MNDEELLSCFSRVKNLTLSSNNWMNEIINVLDLNSLRNLTLGTRSFHSGEYFTIENTPKLEDIELGDEIFNGVDDDSSAFTIRNSPLLVSVSIKSNSFVNIKSLVLSGKYLNNNNNNWYNE